MKSLYDFYDYKVYAEGPVIGVLDKEYRRFKISKFIELSEDFDLYIRPLNKAERPVEIITKPKGSKYGFYLPFKEDENTIFYERKAPLHYVPYYLEMFLGWKNKTLLHAAAVSKEGKAYVFTGAAGIGKTSSVLNLVRKGYDYLSDDWLIVGDEKAYPFPKTIHIFDYNLSNPILSKKVLGKKIYVYKLTFWFLNIFEDLNIHRYFNVICETLRDLMRIDIDVKRLGKNITIGTPSPIYKVFYLERRNVDEIYRIDVDPRKLARKMAMVNMYERNYFFEEYYKYAYKYDVENRRIERRFEFDLRILSNLFENTSVYGIVLPQFLDLTAENNIVKRFEELQ